MPPKDRVIAEIFGTAPEGLMKTAHTIPWEAVVEGCPPSKAKRLPLVVSRFCAPVNDSLFHHIDNAVVDPMAMVSRGGPSCLLEIPLCDPGTIVSLTSDGESSVRLQSSWNPFSARFVKREYRRDAFARSYVARYARFDADARAFMPADTAEDERNVHPRYEFLYPVAWGFTPGSNEIPKSMHWTANNLFRSPTPVKSSTKTPPATRPRFKDPFEEPTIDRGDPFQCIPQLKQQRTICGQATGGCFDPLPSPAHYCGLALSLGRCRLFGVRLRDTEDFTLSQISFHRASAHLIDYLKEAYEWAVEIQENCERYSAYLHRNFALELLEIRMDAHATYLALDEAYAAATYECEPTAETIGRRLNQVRRVINLFDGNLQKQLPLLSLAASTFLLENWRRLLAPTYRELPPWWLDGCLEQ